MINAYSIGFVLTAATVLGGVDYYDQSNKAGHALGQMPVAAYFETIPDRFLAAKAEKQAGLDERERQSRWRQGGQVFLPEAPEGWTRRALLEGDDTQIMPPEARTLGDGAGKSFLQQMEAREHVTQQKERAERSWVYERGTEAVFVEVQLVERPDTSSLFGVVASAMDDAMLGAFDKNVGYGVFGGFGLTEKLKSGGKRPYHFRYLEGAIGFGQEVHLKVHANASREATYEILSAIDYDGLNNLLPTPIPSVGNDVTVPEDLDPVALSMELRRLKSDFLGLRALEAQYKVANMDTGALLANVYAARLGSLESGIDITGGKVTDLSGLVEHGYYTGLQAVMAGKSAEEVQAEVKQMVETAMMVVDAETAAAAARAANAPEPEMSPELKAELASLEASGGKRAAPVPTGGSPFQELDMKATKAAGFKPISGQGDVMRMKVLAGQLDMSDKEVEQSLQGEVFKFADKFGVPAHSCKFVVSATRIECSEKMSEAAMARIGAENRARDMKQAQGGKVLMQVDEAASDRAAGKVYSQAIDLVEYEKFKEARNATEAEMKMGMMIAAAGFEKKHGLGKGTCTFSNTRLRLECDSAKAAGSGGGISGFLSKLTGGAASKQQNVAPTKPVGLAQGELPKRLELSNTKPSGGKRCVGSFCN